MEVVGFDKVVLSLNASAEYVAQWLEHYSRDVDKAACGDDDSYRLFLRPAERITQPQPEETLALSMEGNFLSLASGQLGRTVPVIAFELVPLTEQRVEVIAAYRHSLAKHYLALLLWEMASRWPLAREQSSDLLQTLLKEAGLELPGPHQTAEPGRRKKAGISPATLKRHKEIYDFVQKRRHKAATEYKRGDTDSPTLTQEQLVDLIAEYFEREGYAISTRTLRKILREGERGLLK